MAKAQPQTIPKHVAVIMDGNGRWAQKRFLPRALGHKAGAKQAHNLVEACGDKGVEAVTLYTFSSENWLRPKEEVSFLMNLYIEAFKKEAKELHQNNVQLKVIGSRHGLPEKLIQTMNDVEALTGDNTGLKLRIAINYGAQWEITDACKQIASKVSAGDLSVDQIDEQCFESHLTTSDCPPVDLFIRTSGEIRISNFLLWQIAYAELYFTAVHFPDFSPAEFEKALDWFSNRTRRFGKTTEQLKEHS